VTGAVEDVRPYLQAAQIVVAPIRIARGVQNKVLEAMAMAKALVATPAALEGVNVDIGKEAVAAASPEAFAAEAVRLLSDPETARAIGAAGRARMLADYQWPSQLVRLDDVLDRLTGPLPSGEPDASD
jgi:glycosyltransferase involved in cell wall biosynthesis